MSGRRPDQCKDEELNEPGLVKCMALVYEGPGAIGKIRDVLGPTDPTKAPEGTVRREFGTDVMVNSAHASDSAESFERESKVIRIDENDLGSIIDDSLK
jgi:nucleoside diphosphate kinase